MDSPDATDTPQVAPSPSTPPQIDTAPLPSPSTQAAAPPLDPQRVLAHMVGDHEFQSGSPSYQRAAIDKVMSELDPEYQKFDKKNKDDFLNTVINGIPAPDPLYYRRAASKIYTPALATLGGIGAEAASVGASGPLAAGLGITAGLAAAHGIDRSLGIRKPLSTMGGIGSEIVQDGLEGAANVATGEILGPLIGGVHLAPADREVLESARNMGVQIPVEAVTPNNPIIGTLASGLRTLPGSKQVADAFDAKTLQQLTAAHKSILENGDVNMSLEDYGNAIQKHLDDFVRNNAKLTASQARNLKDAILSRFGSPLSYDELGQTMQKQAQTYFEDMAKNANTLYEHARNSFDPNFSASITSTQEAAHNMALQSMKSQPQFQDSTTGSLLKNLSGATEIEAMIAKRNAEIEAAKQQFVSQGFNPETPVIQAQLPKPISESEINSFMGGRTMPLDKLMKLKSDLGDAIRKIDQSSGFATGPTPGFGTIDSGLLKQVHNAVSDDIATAFDQSSPAAKQAYEAANTFYKFYMGETDKKALQGVLRSQTPETIYDGLVKPGTTTGIDMAKRAMPPPAFKEVQNRFMNDFLDPGIDAETGESNPLTGAFIRKQINKWSAATIDHMFDPQTAAAIYKLPEHLDSLPSALPDNPIFKKIIGGPGGPSVVEALFHKGGTQNVKDVMGSLDPEGQQLMKQAFLGRLLQTNTHGQLSGTAMDSAKNAYGPEMLDTMLGDAAEQKKVGDFINLTYQARNRIAAAQNPSGTGKAMMAARMLRQALQSGPVQFVTQFAPTELLANAYYHPVVQKWLTDGAVPYGKQMAQPLANMLAGTIEGGGDESGKRSRR